MAQLEPVWLEVALNGPWSPERQPGIPVLADQIVAEALACADEGAAIIHFHASRWPSPPPMSSKAP